MCIRFSRLSFSDSFATFAVKGDFKIVKQELRRWCFRKLSSIQSFFFSIKKNLSSVTSSYQPLVNATHTKCQTKRLYEMIFFYSSQLMWSFLKFENGWNIFLKEKKVKKQVEKSVDRKNIIQNVFQERQGHDLVKSFNLQSFGLLMIAYVS